MSDTAENEDQQASAPEPIGDNQGDNQNESDMQKEGEGQEGEHAEVVVTIGDEQLEEDDEQKAPDWVRELRHKFNESEREKRELREKLKTFESPSQAAGLPGKKPTLEDCDYDSERYEQNLSIWYEKKRDADQAAAKAEAERQDQQRAWQSKLDDYNKAKTSLKVADYQDAEETASEILNVTQQGIVLNGAENPALVIYALGKNRKKAQELAGIADPVKFAFAIAKLEGQLKVTKRAAPPPPEKVITGTGGKSGIVDSTLERLREEAARTGDMTKVVAYKRQKRSA